MGKERRGGGAGREKHLNSNRRSHLQQPSSPPPPQPDGIEKGLSVRREQGGVGGGGVEEGEARSRKFLAIPEIKKNAGDRWTQEAPLPLSKPRLHLICNHKYFVMASVQPNDGRMLNNSSLSLLLKNRLKRMLILFSLSIRSKHSALSLRETKTQRLGTRLCIYILCSRYINAYIRFLRML